MPILDLNSMKVETKWHELKRKAKKACTDALNWAKENPELTALGAAGIGAAAKGLKAWYGRTIFTRNSTIRSGGFMIAHWGCT